MQRFAIADMIHENVSHFFPNACVFEQTMLIFGEGANQQCYLLVILYVETCSI